MSTSETTICASYKCTDGWHVFSCDDLPGLYVAHKDAKVAYDDVALSIQTLMKLDRNIDCQVRPVLEFHEWLRDQGDMPASPNRSRRFVLSHAPA
jgi:hypothetical protein